MSLVHTNKTLARLRERGLLSLRNGTLSMLDGHVVAGVDLDALDAQDVGEQEVGFEPGRLEALVREDVGGRFRELADRPSP